LTGLILLSLPEIFPIVAARVRRMNSNLVMAKSNHRALDVVARICTDRELRLKIMKAAKRAGAPLTEQAVSEWRKLKKGVPPSRASLVARVLKLSLHEVRPDIFPRR